MRRADLDVEKPEVPPTSQDNGDEETAHPHEIGDEEISRSKTTESVAETLSPFREFLFVAVISITQFTTQIGFGQCLSILHIIGNDFGLSDPSQLPWLVAGYSLTVGTFILFMGRLGDTFGYKRMIIIGFCWFSFWSMVAGLSVYSNHVLFIFARVFQGIGPSILLPNALATIGATYAPGPRKNMVFAIFGACAPSGAIVGSLFASLFALAWWPWAFFSLAIALAVIAAVAVVAIPDPPRKSKRQEALVETIKNLDLPGAVTGIAALLLINFAWNQAPIVGWQTPYVYVLLIIGFLFVALFFFIELRVSKSPLIPFDVFSSDVAFVLACVACGWSCFGIFAYYVFNFAEVLKGASPLLVTAYLCPLAVSGAGAAVVTGLLLGRLRPAWLMTIALTFFTVGTILIATAPVGQTYWAQFFVCTIVIPWGMDMSFPAATLLLSNAMPKEHQGVGASLVNTIVNYSISLGLGFAGTVEVHVDNGGKTPAEILHGYRGGLYMGIGLAGLGLCSKVASPLRAPYSPPKRTTRQTRSRNSKAPPSEPSPPTTAESENNTDAENTQTDDESIEAVEAENTREQETRVVTSQSEAQSSHDRTPRSKANLYNSLSPLASAEKDSSPSKTHSTMSRSMETDAIRVAATQSAQRAEPTAASSMESVGIQTTPGLIQARVARELNKQTSPVMNRTLSTVVSQSISSSPLRSSPLHPSPLRLGESPPLQKRHPVTRHLYWPDAQLYKLTRETLIGIIRTEREYHETQQSVFSNDRFELTRLGSENSALKLSLHKSLHKKRALPSDDEAEEGGNADRPATRRRLNPQPQVSSQTRSSPSRRTARKQQDPHITRLLFGSAYPAPPVSDSEDDDTLQLPLVQPERRIVDAYLFPDAGSTKYITGNAERFQHSDDEDKENQTEAGPSTSTQTSAETTPQKNRDQAPETPATSRWGVRSLFGSVSRYIPGFRGVAHANDQPEDRADSAAHPSSATNPERGQEKGTNESSSVSGSQPHKARQAASEGESDKQTPPRTQQPAESKAPQTEPVKRQSQEPSRGPASDRRNTPRQQRRNADARFAVIKAREREQEELRLRSERQLKELEEAKDEMRQARRGVEKDHKVGQKRKRVRVDDLKVIPAGPPGTYGMLDRYFEQGSDSEDDYVELDESTINEQETPRPAKRVRFEDSPPATRSSPSRLSPARISSPTPAPRGGAIEPQLARPYTGRLFADSADKTIYRGGNAFKQLTGQEDAPTPARPSSLFNTSTTTLQSNAPRPAAQSNSSRPTTQALTPRSKSFNWEGHFAVPDSSDSESASDEERSELGDAQGPDSKNSSAPGKETLLATQSEAKQSVAEKHAALEKRVAAARQSGAETGRTVEKENLRKQQSPKTSSGVSEAADEFVAILKNDLAQKQRERGEKQRDKEEQEQERRDNAEQNEKQATFLSPSTTNIFMSSAQRENKNSISGLGNVTPISPFFTPQLSTPTFTPPPTLAPSESPHKQAQAKPAWTEPTTPVFNPFNATLAPAAPPTTTAVTALANTIDNEALARARSAAEKYKPKVPSRLQASSRLSTSTVGSDVGDTIGKEEGDHLPSENSDASTLNNANTNEDAEETDDDGKTGIPVQPARTLSGRAAPSVEPASVESTPAVGGKVQPAGTLGGRAAPSVGPASAENTEMVTKRDIYGPARAPSSKEASNEAAPVQSAPAGREIIASSISTAPAFVSGIQLEEITTDAEVRNLVASMTEEEVLSGFEFAWPAPIELELDDEVRRAVEETVSQPGWEEAAFEEFERGYHEWLQMRREEGNGAQGGSARAAAEVGV